jgi:single-stranded-DNA-specific exonuclease
VRETSEFSKKENRPQRERIWSLRWQGDEPERESNARSLAASLGIRPLTARLLCNRGYSDPESAAAFLSCGGMQPHDPFLLTDMHSAVERVLAAVRDCETVAVYGDYDVDGVTSVTCLYLYLRGLGVPVVRYIPNRLREGYGLSRTGIDALADRGVSLIVTVDTGVTAVREIAYAAELGMDTVVTDHHECQDVLPACAAVVNPRRPDCSYPFRELAGVGVAFKLICACEQARTGGNASDVFEAVSGRFIDLVAVGTIADVMPLCDENRLLVSRGLERLNRDGGRPGIAALLDAAAGKGTRSAAGDARRPRRRVGTTTVGFGIAPRLNAAGRITDAMESVELLLAGTPEEAQSRAEVLCRLNARRQEEENRIANEAYCRIDAELSSGDAPWNRQVLVLEDDGWAQGVIGIVSSRITEKYGLPSILISFADVPEEDGQEIGKGSGRSVPGLNLVDALSYCRDLLVRFGGHEMAAGLCIRRKDIPAFRKRLNEYAAAHLTDDMTALRQDVECCVTADELTMEQARELEMLEPCGTSNPTPLLMLENAAVQQITALSGGKHTRLSLYADGRIFPALWFGMPTSSLSVQTGDRVDVLFQLGINEYQGVETLQLILRDVRRSAAEEREKAEEDRRLNDLLNGGALSPEEGLLPDRNDVARVYICLRDRARHGMRTVRIRELRQNLATDGVPLCYIKLMLILRILNEMAVCRIGDVGDGILTYEITPDVPHTSVEASPLLRSLRERCGRGSAEGNPRPTEG